MPMKVVEINVRPRSYPAAWASSSDEVCVAIAERSECRPALKITLGDLGYCLRRKWKKKALVLSIWALCSWLYLEWAVR